MRTRTVTNDVTCDLCGKTAYGEERFDHKTNQDHPLRVASISVDLFSTGGAIGVNHAEDICGDCQKELIGFFKEKKYKILNEE